MKLIHYVLIFILAMLPGFALWIDTPMPVYAQQGSTCPRTASATILAGNTATLVSARDTQTDICGFMFTGQTAGTGMQLISGSTNITPVLYMGANGNVTWPYQVVTWSVAPGTAVTVSCGTGNCTGFITYR